MVHRALVSALLTVILALTPAVASAERDLHDIREQADRHGRDAIP